MVDLLEDHANGVFLDEGIPPQPPDDSLQAFWGRHDPIVWHNPPQDPSRETLVTKGGREGPKWSGVQIERTPAQLSGSQPWLYKSRRPQSQRQDPALLALSFMHVRSTV